LFVLSCIVVNVYPVIDKCFIYQFWIRWILRVMGFWNVYFTENFIFDIKKLLENVYRANQYPEVHLVDKIKLTQLCCLWIMWKNILELERPQMKMWHMCISRWAS